MGDTLAAMDRLPSRLRRTWRKPILTGAKRDCFFHWNEGRQGEGQFSGKARPDSLHICLNTCM
jgi:hypothetical protein